MAPEITQPPPAWTRNDGRELRRLAKHLRQVNEIAGVFDPSGGVIEGEKRLRYLQLARKLAEAGGGGAAAWADEVAWGKQSKDKSHG